MPTYSYACTACEHRFETVQAFSDSSLTACPECAGRLRKLFSSIGIVFKGSGFYRNDSRSAPVSGEGSSDPKTAEKTKTSEKSEKPEKPEPKKSDSSVSTSSASTPTAAAS